MQLISGNQSILDQYFDFETMSTHFKADCAFLQKKWKPGTWNSTKSSTKVSKKELEDLIDQLYSEVRKSDNSWIEIDNKYSQVIQHGPYRIVIVKEPLSDWLEVTVVKPTKKLSIEDYDFSQSILDHLQKNAKGILISGAPGSGKTTFATALVEMFLKENKIIKTIESPRDLLVDDEIVQYSFNYAPYSEIRDILLLSRPDIAIYDEVRNQEDFLLFKDLRLTGIGLIGVIHATQPVDSVQRFIGTIEMGIIPQVIDTVIFIESGTIKEILQLQQVVKVPSGMISADLARPVIEISSFLTQTLKYEIYTYGEQVVVMPLELIKNSAQWVKKNIVSDIANEKLSWLLTSMFHFPVSVEVQSLWNAKLFVNPQNKWKIIWKGGEIIQDLEKRFGLRIDVVEDESLKDFWGSRMKRRK
jgi:ATPase